MKAFLATLTLAGMLLAGAPAHAADPTPSPKGGKALPIRGVTVDVQQMKDEGANDMNSGASHIEAPPFASPRRFRMNAAPAAESAQEMAPAPAAPAARPAAQQRAKPVAPSPSPSPRR